MVISPSLIISSLNLGILTILLGRIFFFSKSYFSKGNVNFPLIKTTSACLSVNKDKEETIEYKRGPFAMAILKVLAFLSVLSLLVTVKTGFREIKITLSLWLRNTPLKISLNFIYDQYFLVFLSVALIVT